MTRSTNRRAAEVCGSAHVGRGGAATFAGRAGTLARLACAVAGAGLLLLAGCSAGQIAETARKNPSVQGANGDARLADGGGSVSVRDVLVSYPGPEGYERGADAPLEVRIFNDTLDAVTVQVRPSARQGDEVATVEARSVALVGDSASASAAAPSASPSGDSPSGDSPSGDSPSGDSSSEGSASDGGPARLEIPAGGFVVLTRESGSYLRVDGLTDGLAPGMSVPLRFQFSNGLDIQVNAPVAAPLTAGPRATADVEEEEEGH